MHSNPVLDKRLKNGFSYVWIAITNACRLHVVYAVHVCKGLPCHVTSALSREFSAFLQRTGLAPRDQSEDRNILWWNRWRIRFSGRKVLSSDRKTMTKWWTVTAVRSKLNRHVHMKAANKGVNYFDEQFW